jgi:hypothetical protein
MEKRGQEPFCDANGQLWSVTSCDDAATSGNTVNEVKYTRDAWGNVTRSTQDPNGPAADTDPNVAYTWGYGLSGSAATYARLEIITLPGGRQVYYNYESQYESLAKFASLGRVANIAANGSPDDANTYVAYKYLGALMVVDANHPAVPAPLGPAGRPEGPPSGKLTYAGVTSGDYSGFDRLGRVLWQRWLRSSGSVAADRYFYGYDRAGNRKWRAENEGRKGMNGMKKGS